ncbi:fibrinogen-like protein 1-like protein [Amblyraja radiata]|uniref:fibrinogen-like protein 1-like protein n=1 Tax=Amblyraja radiata TaxID=386614 RepID=UPI001402AD50|nr:fibrinogen-like protein 1-like protein [Amblyraja radiata]
MLSHGMLGSLLLAIFAIGLCSAMTNEFRTYFNGIGNAHALTNEQQMKIKNLKTGTNGRVHLHQDCKAINRFGNKDNGIYVIKPQTSPPVLVYCDMKTEGGGWILLQNVTRGSSVFSQKKWVDYKTTFGNLEGNYWLGNEHMHAITKQQRFEVKFIIQNGTQFVHVDYSSFNIDEEKNNYALRLGYPLKYSEYYDVLTEQDNMMFSTEDEDNDRDANNNCAKMQGAGWWFNKCSSAMFFGQRIKWPRICDDCESAAILIKPTTENCISNHN